MKSPAPDEITKKFWGDAATGRKRPKLPVHWLCSPLVLRICVNRRISGDPDLGWLEWVQREFFPEPVEKGFVLGCGGGQLERRAAALGICRDFYGVDISPEAIEVARALAVREGWTSFRYETSDANDVVLDRNSLDLVLCDMSLHHITKLEHLLDQFRQALRPAGLLVLNEFVGPDRFQWTDLQLQLATENIRSLPLRLRRNQDMAAWKRLLKRWVFRAKRWSPERVARMDPSESVRSSQIPELVSSRFDIVRRINYGGTLMALVLNNIVGNFSESPEDVALLKRLGDQEEALMQAGKISSDYVLIVARRP